MPQSVLRVCSDPNNLPFSNHQQKGFENDLARMVAHDLGMTLSYTWAPQRSRFFQKTLLAGICDVAMGLPSRMDLASTTVPYYRSTYFFVARRDRISNICSFDDPRVRQMRIGVHSIGDDNANLPPATALADRGLARNVVGYSIYGNLAQPNPPAELIRAVADGDVDVAVAWGPLAGYFAQRSAAPLKLTPVCPSPSDAALGFAFDISMGVRHGDTRLLDRLNAEIERRRPEIGQLLQKYGIPTLPLDPARPAGKAAVTAKSE
jgi:quinoprotein dehydrogenase-associated probable ABC transporter substrate-binding protein